MRFAVTRPYSMEILPNTPEPAVTDRGYREQKLSLSYILWRFFRRNHMWNPHVKTIVLYDDNYSLLHGGRGRPPFSRRILWQVWKYFTGWRACCAPPLQTDRTVSRNEQNAYVSIWEMQSLDPVRSCWYVTATSSNWAFLSGRSADW